MGAVYLNENQILIAQMIEIYKPEDFDWMSYQITKKNILTFHHIIEESRGGVTSIENGALLTKKAHRILSMLYDKDFMLYEDWQQFFEYVNKRYQPLDDYSKGYSRTLKKHTVNIIYK